MALVLAALVALGLFGLMQALVRPPREAPAARPPAAVAWPARVPERASPEPSRPHPGEVPKAVSRPSMQEGTRAAPVRISRLPLTLSPHPAIVARTLGFPLAALHARLPLDWSTALTEYLTWKGKPAPLFRLPRLRPRPPSPLKLPQRMRLGTGGEIDRIGTQCYATSFDIADNPEASSTPVIAREMHAMQSLFAHEIPCDADALQTLGDEFLRKLRKLARVAPTPPGTR